MLPFTWALVTATSAGWAGSPAVPMLVNRPLAMCLLALIHASRPSKIAIIDTQQDSHHLHPTRPPSSTRIIDIFIPRFVYAQQDRRQLHYWMAAIALALQYCDWRRYLGSDAYSVLSGVLTSDVHSNDCWHPRL